MDIFWGGDRKGRGVRLGGWMRGWLGIGEGVLTRASMRAPVLGVLFFLLSQVSQGIVMDCDLVNYECIWDCVRVCLTFYAVFAPKIIRNTQSFHILSLQTCANSSRNNQLIEEKRPVVFEK